MAIREKLFPPTVVSDLTPLTQDDLLQASKAIHDGIKDRLEGRLAKMLADSEGRILSGLARELDRRLSALVPEMIRRESGILRKELQGELSAVIGQAAGTHRKSLENLQDGYTKGLSEMKDAIKREKGVAQVIADMLRKEIGGEVASLIQSYDTKLIDIQRDYRKELEDRIALLNSAHDKRLAEVVDSNAKALLLLQSGYTKGLEQISELLKGLPVPMVQITHPDVVVNVPEQKDLPAPVINVAAPELRPADIKVLVPPARKWKKNIEYDEMGRPCTISESEEEENS